MKKVGKILGIMVVVAAVGLVALLILVKLLVTPERVRAVVLPLASDALHRQVSLGEVEVSLFSGIVLKDFKVLEPEGQETFVGVETLVLRYQLWPLLRKQIIVDEVAIVAPRIRVVRLADGRFNFSDLLEQPEAAVSKPAAEPTAAPVNLLVSAVSIEKGTLQFIDYAVDAADPFRFQAEEFTLQARTISLDQPFPFEVQTLLNRAPLHLRGQADLAGGGGQVQLELKQLDLTAFAPYFQAQLPGKLDSLRLSLDLETKGNAQLVESQGRVTLDQLNLQLQALPEAPLQQAQVTLAYQVRAELDKDRLVLGKNRLEFNGLPLEFGGTVDALGTAPQIDLQLRIPGVDLVSALQALPPALVASARDLAPAGSIQLQAHVRGAVSAPQQLLQSAAVRFDQVSVQAAGLRPVLNGSLHVSGEALQSEDLNLRLGDSDLALVVQAQHLRRQPLALTCQVSAEKLLLDPLLGGPATKEPVPAGAESATEIGPFDLPLRLDGSVKLKQALYQKLSIDDFDLVYQLVDNVLTVKQLTGKVAQGSFTSHDRIDLGKKGLVYDLGLNLRQVQAEALVAGLYPAYAGSVFGAMDLNLQVSGAGTQVETLQRKLSGKGDFILADGKVTGAGLAEGLAAFVELEDLRVLRFKRFSGTFRIDQGRVTLDSGFSGGDMKMEPQGTVGLDGSLDLKLDGRLAPDLTRRLAGKGDLGRLISDEQGWGLLPLRVKGTLAQPQFKLDSAALRRQVGEKAKQKLEQAVEKKLLGKDSEKKQDAVKKELK